MDRVPIRIFVDADACPVKAEIYRVAERHGIKVLVVSNSLMAIPAAPWIERVIVASGPDAADDWIAERAVRGDVVVTQRHSARGAGGESGGRRDRSDRACIHRGVDRRHAGDAQSDGRTALGAG